MFLRVGLMLMNDVVKWDDLLKSNDKITITFDSGMYQELRLVLGVSSFVCCYCSIRVTKRNIGAFLGNNRICCKRSCCLIKYVKEVKS